MEKGLGRGVEEKLHCVSRNLANEYAYRQVAFARVVQRIRDDAVQQISGRDTTIGRLEVEIQSQTSESGGEMQVLLVEHKEITQVKADRCNKLESDPSRFGGEINSLKRKFDFVEDELKIALLRW